VIAFERLAMLALGELPVEEAVVVEEHVLGCTGCAAVLERLLELGERIGEVTRHGEAFLLAGRPLVDQLQAEGMITRRYEMGPGGEVSCTVDARDIYTCMCLKLDARALRRIDLIYEAPSARYRVEDLPFGPDEVVFVQPATYIRTLPTERKTIRLMAVDDEGERAVATYVLNHTAFRPS
jgi:hypothetical protein